MGLEHVEISEAENAGGAGRAIQILSVHRYRLKFASKLSETQFAVHEIVADRPERLNTVGQTIVV